jgi:toxin YoeB
LDLKKTERRSVFTSQFREDLKYWTRNDRKIAMRVLDLVEDVMRSPFEGIGKPEPMRFDFAGCWSRRISAEHRLVYEVTGESVTFLQARYHYEA